MDIEFQKRLLATFGIEAKEHLNSLSAGLVALENTTDEAKRREIVEAVFREARAVYERVSQTASTVWNDR